MKTMKILMASAVLASGIGMAIPASAQRITIGPNGPGVDLRSSGERRRDRMMQMDRRDRMYQQQRFQGRDRNWRRDYRY